jgi:hypothetical protein
MKRPRKYEWQYAIDHAVKVLTPFGFAVERSLADYEIAKVTGHGVSLVIYPHKVSSTGNRHVRIRDNGSKDKTLAAHTIKAMQKSVSPRCDWSCKTWPADIQGSRISLDEAIRQQPRALRQCEATP